MKRINIPTLIAITIITWSMVNVTHETLGHAGFGLLSGFQIKAVNTTTAYLDVNWENEITQNGFQKLRLFLYGGVLMNLITGIIALCILRYVKFNNAQGRYFLWLFASFSYVVVVMNFVTAPLTGGGDLAEIIRTYDNQLLVRLIVFISGVFILIFGFRALQLSFMPVTKDLRNIRFSFSMIPLVTIIVLQTLSILKSPFASLPPAQNHLLVSIFAYFHFLIWSLFVYFFPNPGKKNLIENSVPSKSLSWIIAGVIITLFYIFILGPGIGSFDGHPMLSID